MKAQVSTRTCSFKDSPGRNDREYAKLCSLTAECLSCLQSASTARDTGGKRLATVVRSLMEDGDESDVLSRLAWLLQVEAAFACVQARDSAAG